MNFFAYVTYDFDVNKLMKLNTGICKQQTDIETKATCIPGYFMEILKVTVFS